MTGEPGPGDLAATLSLADWRRSIGTLYVEVRRLAADDPATALAHWRAVREELFRNHPQSPLPVADRASFKARHFDHDPNLRFVLTVEPLAPVPAPDAGLANGAIDFGSAPTVGLPVSGGGTMAFHRFGAVTVPFAAGPRRLEVFWMEGYAGGLFLPFRDATNGSETYGAGRYLLDGAKSADLGGHLPDGDGDRDTHVGGEGASLILDFNFAFQPSCAFDPRFACPLSPPSNLIDIQVRAGERLA
ncbi:MAG: DUF1684 domain-containing protein [Chloroflexi bacterium]|nr:DUF1684 domain-containing protein [Chloroflexota bacterium]